MGNSDRAERRAQKKYDRSEKRHSEITNKVLKGEKYSEKKYDRLTDKWLQRLGKLSETKDKSTSESTPLTGEELFGRNPKRASKQVLKKGETVSASRGSMSKPTFTPSESRELSSKELFKDRKTPRQVVSADSKSRELTADELYLNKKTPRQVVRAFNKEARTEARAAAAAARARKYSS
jgi:hypothetical protein